MGAAVLGMAVISSFPPVLVLDLTLGLDVLPSGLTAARDLGVWNVAYHAGRVAAPLIGWQILDRADPGGSGGYTVLFLAAAAVFWGGSLVVLRVRGVR